MQIAILGHWHTGSSILARAFQICGMETGNENTLWGEECEAQCEHGVLNRIGDELCIGKRTDLNEAQSLIEAILEDYVIEAAEHNWANYGVKVSHALQAQAWPAFKKAFEVRWPEAKYIIPVRSPLAIIKSTDNDPSWTPERIIESIKSTFDATNELYREKQAIIMQYPLAWMQGGVQKTIEILGLEWKEEAGALFDVDRLKTFTEAEILELGHV